MRLGCRSTTRTAARAAMAAAVAATIGSLATGCAGVKATRLATAGPPAYELGGSRLAALKQQADALCPQGYTAVREWERLNAPAGEGAEGAAWWHSAAAVVQAGKGDAAQMTVQCAGAATPAAPVGGR